MSRIPPRTDVLVALVLAAWALADLWLGSTGTDRAVAVPAALVMTLALAWWRRYPLAVIAAIAAAVAAQSALTDPPDGLWTAVAVLLAVFGGASRLPRTGALLAAALGVVAFAVPIARSPSSHAADYGYTAILVAAVWQAGRVLRRRRLQAERLEDRVSAAEREREVRARAAVAEERARIARELHDVVAHSVSVAVVQAEAGEALLERDPAAAAAAFRAIQDTGRQALAELSRLLGILRKDDDGPALAPPASVTRLEPLVEQVREAGLPVEVTVQGEPRALPPGVDLSAYRIIQEALTNSLKHAGEAHAAVTLRYAGEALELEVLDDGRGATAPRTDGGAHGLIGMRERVALYGGDLQTGRRPEGGYAVRARLPLDPRG